MRGSIWTIVGLGVMVVFVPLLLDIDVSGDETGQTAMDLLSSVEMVIAVAFVVAVFGLLNWFFTSDI